VSASAGQRPGHPDGAHPLAILAYLGALFGIAALGWALLAGVVWLVWAYTLVALSILVGGGLVVLVIRLALKRGGLAWSAALFAALVAFVGWVVRR
jgi:hypothetical protein